MTVRTLHLGLASVFASLLLLCTSGETIGSTACFDIEADGANITHIFIVSDCELSPSDFAVTVDGEPVSVLSTDDNDCDSLPWDAWFPLKSRQSVAHVCVSIPSTCPVDSQIYVYGKAGSECIAGVPPAP
jgi:hypothetical protein